MSKNKFFNFSRSFILGTAIMTFASSSMAMMEENTNPHAPAVVKASIVPGATDEGSSKKQPLHSKLQHFLALDKNSETLFPKTWDAASRQKLTQILYQADAKAIEPIAQILLKYQGNKGVYMATSSLTESVQSFVQSLASCSPLQLSSIHTEFDALFPTGWNLDSCAQLVQLLSNTDPEAIPVASRFLGQTNWGEQKYAYRLSNSFTDEMRLFVKTILSIE